jgi:RNA-binding protein
MALAQVACPAMTPEKRRQLRARAHALDPVVMVGQSGVSAGVLREIERALKNHELIKVRVAGADRAGRERMLEEICTAASADPVQHIGRMLVIFRENPDLHVSGDAPAAPSARRRPPARKGARRRLTRSERP